MPPLLMVKVPPCRSARVSLSSRALLPQLGDLLLDLRHRQRVGVAQHRHHQPAAAGHRDADVVVVLEDDLVALDLGVDQREGLQRLDRRRHEEAHEAQLHAVPLLEPLGVGLPQRHHRAHVDLVEGGEDGGVVLRREEPLGDALAQRRHRHPLLAGAGRRGRPARSRRSAGRRRAGRGAAAVPPSSTVSTSSLVTRPAGAAAPERRRGPARWRRRWPGRPGSSAPGARHRRRAGLGGGHGRGPGRRRRAALGQAPPAAAAAAPRPAAMLPSTSPIFTVSPSPWAICGERAGGRRRHVDGDLVGLEHHHRLVDLHRRRRPSCATCRPPPR